jgi:hypothetical protein
MSDSNKSIQVLAQDNTHNTDITGAWNITQWATLRYEKPSSSVLMKKSIAKYSISEKYQWKMRENINNNQIYWKFSCIFTHSIEYHQFAGTNESLHLFKLQDNFINVSCMISIMS